MNTDKRLLQEAAAVIKNLRDENHYLKTRLSGFDDALRLLNAGGRSGQGLTAPMTPDIIYRLEKRVAEIETEEKRLPQAAPPMTRKIREED